jgi:SAM-dependent methyltransferase
MEDQVYRQLYEVENEHWWYAARKEILLRYLDVRLPLPPSARLLDVGCGTGAILESFSRRYEAFGTDTAPQAIEFCRERGLTRLYCGTLDTYPPSEPFDLITMLDMVEHVEDDEGLLRAGLRLLNDGGHVLIAVPAFPSSGARLTRSSTTKGDTRGAVSAALSKIAGFTVEHLTFFNCFLFPVAWVKRIAARATGGGEAHDLDIPPRPLNAASARGVPRRAADPPALRRCRSGSHCCVSRERAEGREDHDRGTAYPLRGGIAHYNGLLYRELSARHEVDVVTFTRQYPGFLFPGKTQSGGGGPADGFRVPSSVIVDSINPLNWVSVGRTIRSRRPDLLIFKYWLPFFGPCFGTIARVVKGDTGRRSCSSATT